MSFTLSFFGSHSVSSLCKATGIIGILAGCPILPRYLEVKETSRTVTYNFAVAQGMMQGRFLNGTLSKQENIRLRYAQARALSAIEKLSDDEDDDDDLKEAGQQVSELLWQIEH